MCLSLSMDYRSSENTGGTETKLDPNEKELSKNWTGLVVVVPEMDGEGVEDGKSKASAVVPTRSSIAGSAMLPQKSGKAQGVNQCSGFSSANAKPDSGSTSQPCSFGAPATNSIWCTADSSRAKRICTSTAVFHASKKNKRKWWAVHLWILGIGSVVIDARDSLQYPLQLPTTGTKDKLLFLSSSSCPTLNSPRLLLGWWCMYVLCWTGSRTCCKRICEEVILWRWRETTYEFCTSHHRQICLTFFSSYRRPAAGQLKRATKRIEKFGGGTVRT